MEKVLQELFWVHFLGVPILFKQYQNTSWMWHCQFGIDKCTMLGMKKGEIVKSDGIQLFSDKVINSLEKRAKAVSI